MPTDREQRENEHFISRFEEMADAVARVPGPAVNEAYRLLFAQRDRIRQLEEMTTRPAAAVTEDLRDALRSIRSRITSSAMDYGDYEPNAWVYGIAVGWDCEEDHDHDGICGGNEAMVELAASFGWDEAAVARLRTLRKAYAAASEPVSSSPAGAAGEDEGL